MEVVLKDVKDVALVKSKQWINWSRDYETLIAPGVVLTFRLNTFERYKSKRVFAEIATNGIVTMETTTKETIQVGTVEFTAGECAGNPVVDYLSRTGKPVEQAVFFDNGGYSVLPDPKGEPFVLPNTGFSSACLHSISLLFFFFLVFSSSVTTPSSNVAYARISHDLNPIHVNPYFADFAELPDTITHGYVPFSACSLVLCQTFFVV